MLTCAFCDKEYVESENKDDSCEWFSETYKGRFIVDEDSDLWYKWHEGRGNRNGKFCRKNYCNDGGYVWSICRCQNNNGECVRNGKHKTEFVIYLMMIMRVITQVMMIDNDSRLL